MNNKYNVIGVMSGTSLDGVDIAFCEFNFDGRWTFLLKKAETVFYSEKWKKNLNEIYNGSALEISDFDCAYGKFLGELVKGFCEKHKIVPDFISSHGHTIFHQPDKGFTKQIGSGSHLSAATGFPVICDFRSADVALGGQGAPLVPIGDKYLFSDFDYCLNLGGIANISFESEGNRRAYDVCACNFVLNYFAQKAGLSFDKGGELASTGKVNSDLINSLNSLAYYAKSFPKSLGREEVEGEILPLIERYNLKIPDSLATFCEHIATIISRINSSASKSEKMLITGGGALNTFLVKLISQKSKCTIVVPEKDIIDFKEAIIFAFLGVLRMRGEINCLKSVTGAKRDNSGGAIYYP